MAPWQIVAPLLMVACAWAVLTVSACARTAVHCDRVASPTGRDTGAGTAAQPFRTLSRLIASLSAGEVGCLRSGTYGGRAAKFVLSRPHSTIMSYPGERATIAGYPVITGDHVRLSHVNLDLDNVGNAGPACAPVGRRRRQAYGLQIDGSDAVIEHDSIYESDVPLRQRAGGVGVGFNRAVSNALIRYNRIYDIGWCPVEDHAIYLDHTSGVKVYGNWIYDVPGGTGVQLWSTTVHSHIYENVIDHAASGFTLGCCAARGDTPTHGNLIDHNIVSDDVGTLYSRFDPRPPTGPDPGVTVWAYWSAAPGYANIYRDNLAHCSTKVRHCGTSPGNIRGLFYVHNAVGDPRFLNAAAHDYRVAATSPAAAWHLWDGDLGASSGK